MCTLPANPNEVLRIYLAVQAAKAAKEKASMESNNNVLRVQAQAAAATAAGLVIGATVPALPADYKGLRDYLSWEDTRNVQGFRVIRRFLERATGHAEGLDVVVGHHITFLIKGKGPDGEETILRLPNEIPSADTIWFDHDLMHLVFKDDYKAIMANLALRVPELRERILNNHLDALDRAEGKTPPQIYDRVETAELMKGHLSDGRVNPLSAETAARN